MSTTSSPPPIPGAPHSSPAAEKPPFAKTAAQFCAWSPLVAIALNILLGGAARQGEPGSQGSIYIGPAVMILGIVLGIFALCNIPKHGSKGILIPSLIGIVINVALVVLAYVAVQRLIEKSEAIKAKAGQHQVR